MVLSLEKNVSIQRFLIHNTAYLSLDLTLTPLSLLQCDLINGGRNKVSVYFPMTSFEPLVQETNQTLEFEQF